MAAIERYPVVLKFDGLAAGKGVVIAADEAQARATLEDFLVARRFGAGRVVVEEHLEGEELSLLALCDGERARADGAGAGLQAHLRRRRGAEHRRDGLLLAGAGRRTRADRASSRRSSTSRSSTCCASAGPRFTASSTPGSCSPPTGPKVLEYNVRFGDPETQAVLPRLRSDAYELLPPRRGRAGLAGVELEFDDGWAVTLVLASAGYPASPSTGDVITGLDDVAADGVEVTHAGTARREATARSSPRAGAC